MGTILGGQVTISRSCSYAVWRRSVFLIEPRIVQLGFGYLATVDFCLGFKIFPLSLACGREASGDGDSPLTG